MKKIWVLLREWNKELVTIAIENGANGLILPCGLVEKVKKIGKIDVISKDGNIILGKDVVYFFLKSIEDEDKIISIAKDKIVILKCNNWTVIPLESIISKRENNIMVQITNDSNAKMFFGILEKGVMGIVLDIENKGELKAILSKVVRSYYDINIKKAIIENVFSVGIGDRVCIDTCSLMLPGQGMLIGNSSSFLFLIHSENIPNFYTIQRPFRVNAGAVNAYVKVPGNKTAYLSDLSSGDSISLINYSGYEEIVVVGRIKIEKRPLILIRARYNDQVGTIIVQNAETVKVVSSFGKIKSVTNLSNNDEILVVIENKGRHFGSGINEFIYEK